ncbi:protein argonaute-1-like [Homarus americanus]|uniref:protein argonaute-1-like n=1 Tax=Homarus americanus TaxID=6706 RepID=UPI001C45331D|nr:protein argonaute-1-like [Homarus americanus]
MQPQMDFMCSSVLVLGGSIDHPQEPDTGKCSIAAVVAVIDHDKGKYAVQVLPQPVQHDIYQLKVITIRLLLEYYRLMRCTKPQRIIMYRIGIPESYFSTVVPKEVAAIHAACDEVQEDTNYNPQITYIVAEKQRQTRFFCKEEDSAGSAGNIAPGTVVDNDITHHTYRDFYLCSHLSEKSTSLPTHYFVLLDENNLTMDQVEVLTYILCHLNARCAHSTSLPMPIVYAQLASESSQLNLVARGLGGYGYSDDSNLATMPPAM